MKRFYFVKLNLDGLDKFCCEFVEGESGLQLLWHMDPIQFVDHLLAYEPENTMIIKDEEGQFYNYQSFLKKISEVLGIYYAEIPINDPGRAGK